MNISCVYLFYRQADVALAAVASNNIITINKVLAIFMFTALGIKYCMYFMHNLRIVNYILISPHHCLQRRLWRN